MRYVDFAEILLAIEVAIDLTLSILLAEMMAILMGSSKSKSQESDWASLQVLAMFRKVAC